MVIHVCVIKNAYGIYRKKTLGLTQRFFSSVSDLFSRV